MDGELRKKFSPFSIDCPKEDRFEGFSSLTCERTAFSAFYRDRHRDSSSRADRRWFGEVFEGLRGTPVSFWASGRRLQFGARNEKDLFFLVFATFS